MIENAYIHIPFCIRKCRYCSFVSGINLNYKKQYLDALLYEIKTRYNNENLKTLYIGGGTPSLLDSCDIEEIISCFSFQKSPEITLEMNPETVTEEKIKQLKTTKVNRISLGVQTFNNKLLKLTGRLHSETDIIKSINYIKNAGFENLSIDLIYGLPMQSMELFKEDLEKAVNIEPKHISVYGLKIEENSYFYNHIPENLPDDELQAEMFLHLCKKLKEENYNHYEISNFAKEGFESQHNNSYWKNKNYYGFGLNASGYENNIRYKNISDFKTYLKTPLKREEEISLTQSQILEDEIFLALRLQTGVDIKSVNNKYNIDFEKKYKKIIDKYTKLNLLEISKNSCRLTENGMLLSNEIMSDFLD